MSIDWASFGFGIAAIFLVVILIALVGSTVDAIAEAHRKRSAFTHLYLGAYGYCRKCRHGLYADSRGRVREMFLEHVLRDHPEGLTSPEPDGAEVAL